MKTILHRKQSGSSLIVVMSILATLMVIVGIAAEYTTSINRNVQRTNTLGTAITIGDSCLEILFSNWRNTCRTSPTTALATSSFSSIGLPTSAMFPSLQALPGFNFGATTTDFYGNNTANPPTISNFKVVAANAEWQPMASTSATPIPIMGQVAGDVDTLTPKTPAVFNYVASADITLPTVKGNVVAKVRRIFQKQQLSPWNFAIFYVDPLEIHPGPLFTVTGWVHTNSDLYTGHFSLTFADKVTYASDWFSSTAAKPGLGFKPGDGQHPANDPANGPPNYLANLPPARDQALQPFGMNSNLIVAGGANQNDDSYRELIEPPVGGSDPMASARYWDQAAGDVLSQGVAIRVEDTPSPNTVTIGHPNSDGSITPFASVPGNATYQALLAMFSAPGTITTNQYIQNDREGLNVGAGQVRLVTLDISKMLNGTGGMTPTYKANDAAGTRLFNGILYIYDKTGTNTLNPNGTINPTPVKRGVRLINGSKIPSTGYSDMGLTVVSSNPVYIQGDYNTGGTGSTVPSNNPSNLNSNGTYINPANPPQPQVDGYNGTTPGTRAPSSILADSVNILSNSWNDGASGNSTTPTASNTTVNTAIIAGIVPTSPVGGDGAYSGGAENFPRFLENWTNHPLTYYGSMVQLFKSQQAYGEWTGNPAVYSPPTRNWFFDTNFKLKPPPGSIMIYAYIKGKWSVL